MIGALTRDLRDATPAERWTALLILLGAVALRLAHLRQPMRHDESYTYLHFASAPLSTALSSYTYPNNHLLHTLLVWGSTRLFGHSPEAIRLPVLVAGVLLVPAVYLLARRWGDRGAALAAAALTATWPALVLYSTNARGHGIIALAFVTLLLLGDRAADGGTTRRWAAIAAVLTAGMYTAPVMLYPAGAVLLWIAAETARRRGRAAARATLPRLFAVAAATAVATSLAYLPVVIASGLEALLFNKYVTPRTLRGLMAELPGLWLELGGSLGFGIPLPLLGALVLAGLVGIAAPGEDRRRRVVLFAAAAGWCVALLLLTRRAPPGRVFLFLVPLGCLFAGLGISRLVGAATRAQGRSGAATAAVAVCLALWIATAIVASRAVFRSPESGTLVDAPDIARYLLQRLRPGDRVAVMNPCGPPLEYYLLRQGGRRLGDINAGPASGRVFAVVNPRHLQTLPGVVASELHLAADRLAPDGPPAGFDPETVFTLRLAARP